MLNTYTLKNGMKVAAYSIPEMKSVYLSLAIKGGSIFDDQKTSGTAHYMEHILFEGSPSYPDVEKLHDFIESIAGSFNAATHLQLIRFYIGAPAKYLEDLLRIGSEVFFEPLFPPDAIDRERRAILEEIKGRKDSLWYKLNEFYGKVRYKSGHPLLLDGGGAEEIVNKLQREDLIAYWEKFFHPKNTYLVMVGGFSHEEAKQLTDKYFNKFSSEKTFPGYPDFTNKDFSPRKVAIRNDQELQTSYVDLSFPSMDDNVPLADQIAQGIAKSILGGLRTSRLYRLLRHKKGLVYDAGISAYIYQKFGLIHFYGQVSVENLEEVVDLVSKEIKGFITTGPTKAELEFAKNYSINQDLMQFDHPSSIAEWIESDLLWEDKVYLPDEYVKIVEKVTIEDIMRVIHKYWDFSKLNLVIQGPIADSTENISKFEKLIEDLK